MRRMSIGFGWVCVLGAVLLSLCTAALGEQTDRLRKLPLRQAVGDQYYVLDSDCQLSSQRVSSRYSRNRQSAAGSHWYPLQVRLFRAKVGEPSASAEKLGEKTTFLPFPYPAFLTNLQEILLQTT